MNESIDKINILRSNAIRRALAAGLGIVLSLSAIHFTLADYVGESQTTIYMDPATQNQISANYFAGKPGISVGDVLTYITQFTPVPTATGANGELIGSTAVITEYIPAGMEVVGADFVQVSGGSYTTINPPPPSAVTSVLLPEYTETGIFYSTDPRTQFYATGGNTGATQINGLQTIAGGPTSTTALTGATITPGATAYYSVHNQWDAAQVAIALNNTNPATTYTTCTLPAVTTYANIPSPVAGPDAFVKNDNTGGVGPWHRISYSGSTYGTNTGTVGTAVGGALGPGCLGGTPTSAGWLLSTSNPLPSNTNALRFIGGQTTVGQLFSVRIQLRVTSSYVTGSTIINNSEVFGGDVSILNSGALGSKSPIWKYLFPSVANSSSAMMVVKSVTGMCVGASCVPQAFTGSTVPAQANLKLQYSLTYLNSSGGPQTNVILKDTMPTGATMVAASAVVVAGANVLPVSSSVGQTFTFATLASMGSGAGGTLNYVLNWLTAPPAGIALPNLINMSSTSIPSGVTSTATVSPTSLASLNINKTTTTPKVGPGAAASYVISIPNNGQAVASMVNVTDTLPSNGLGAAVYNRFTYILNSVVATITNALGVTSTVSPVSAVVAAPTLAPFKETVTFTFPASTVIPSGGTLNINFGAMVGSGVPATTTAYTNNASVAFLGGTTIAANSSVMAIAGVAPVTVIDPMSLTKSIDCVYVGATCMTYTSGSFIPSASKIKYRLTYANTGGAAIAGVVLADTLPASTVFVTGTAAEVAGSGFTSFGTVVPPTVASQVMTFGTIASLPASAVGAVTFDVQLPAASSVPSGSYVTNNATMSSTLYPGGVTANITTSVLDQPLLSITKSVSNSVLPVGGTAAYTITVTNIGSVAASGITVYDALPFVSGVANTTTRFNYASSVAVLPPASSTLATPTVASSVGAGNVITAIPYTRNANQQQVSWTFPASGVLAAGQSVVINMNATAGSGITGSPTYYYNSAQVFYGAGAVSGINASVNNVAGVQIPTGLSILKSIACIYVGTTCSPYNGLGIIPANANVRYQINYSNTSAAAQSAVYICDQLVSSSASAVATVTTPASGVANTAAPNGPPVGAVTSPASSVCGFSGASAVSFNYPVIPSLAAGATGTLYVDTAMSGVVNSSTLTNTAKIVSQQAPSGEFSSVAAVALNVPSLSINKTTTTSNLAASGVASYTITVTNSGSAPTTSLQLYDWLPFSGTAVDTTQRFNYQATSSVVITNASGVGATLPASAVAVSTVVAPTIAPYSSNTNQQQVLWDLGTIAGNQLQSGSTLTINFSAVAGSNLPVGNYGNSAGFAFSSAGGSGTNNVNNKAVVTLVSPPNITFQKTVMAYWDPINLLGNASAVPATAPLYLPGGLAQYTITASNAGGNADNNSVYVTDVVPANMVFVGSDINGVGSGPILFTASTSGLTLTPATDISYSNTTPVWTTYTPIWTACSSLAGTTCDANIRQFKVSPKGVFQGSLTLPTPSFNYKYRMSLN